MTELPAGPADGRLGGRVAGIDTGLRVAKSLTLVKLARMTIAGCVAAASAFAAGAPSPAHACSCIAPPPPQEALSAATAVFTGKVRAVSGQTGGPGELRVTFAVDRVWKGIGSQEVTVTTPASEPACGVSFQTSKDYLVYASGQQGGPLSVSLCSRTAILDAAAADIGQLGPPQAVPGSGTGGPPLNDPRPFPRRTAVFAVAAAIGLVALAGALILSRLGGEPPDER